MADNITTAAETNLITRDQMARVREIDFVNRFGGSILPGLLEALGVTRRVAMTEGTTLYVYKTTGTLEDGNVPEGEVIPLSRFERTKTPVGEIALQKHRKAVSAEAIMRSGRTEAVIETDNKFLQEIQKKIRTRFFNGILGFDGTVVGDTTLQGVLAKTWGNLQILFENDSVEAVYFLNPLTIADYLRTATISMQTAFGFNYISDFLGLGTVIMTSAIPVGQVVSTAKENIIFYYLRMNGDLAQEFDLVTDQTGYIGTHTDQTDPRAQKEMLAMWGVDIFVEYADGIVYGQIDSTPGLQTVTVASTVGTADGDSNIAVSGYTLGSGEKWVYKTAATTAPAVTYGQKLGSGWTTIVPPHDITPTATHTKITVAAVDSNGRAQAAGTDDLTVKE